MNAHVQQSLSRSLLTKVKAISLGLFAAASLSAKTPCCPPTVCPKIDIELCPASFCIKEEIVRAAAGLGCGRIITQCDLPLVITCPGKYSVAQDLNWGPSGAGQAGITVAANDVVIEFNGRTYKQTDSTQANCIGVLINPNLFNVQLLNGTLENFSLWGVKAQSGDRELLFDHINTYSCGYNGNEPFIAGSGGLLVLDVGSFLTQIIHNPTPENPIFDVIVRNCNFNDHYSNIATGGYFGLKPAAFYGVNQLVVENCNCNNNTELSTASNGGSLFGLDIEASQGIRVENCNVNQNTVLNGVGFAGTVFKVCSDVVCRNCNVLDSTAMGGGFQDNHLFLVENVMDGLLENCFGSNFGVQGPAETLVFYVHNSFNCVVKGCVIENVYLIGNTTQQHMQAFLGEGVNQVTFEDCVAQSITGSGGFDTAGFVTLFGFKMVYKNCLAQNITNNNDPNGGGTGASVAAGFFSNGVETAVIYDNCIAQNVAYPKVPANAYGFNATGLFGASDALEISNCVAQANGIGFQLDSLNSPPPFPGVTSSTIRNNVAINNTVYGFNDLATAGNNVFYGNYAYNPGSTGNYNGNGAGEFGLHLGTPIRTWSFTAGQQPDATTDAGNPVSDLDNINVV